MSARELWCALAGWRTPLVPKAPAGSVKHASQPRFSPLPAQFATAATASPPPGAAEVPSSLAAQTAGHGCSGLAQSRCPSVATCRTSQRMHSHFGPGKQPQAAAAAAAKVVELAVIVVYHSSVRRIAQALWLHLGPKVAPVHLRRETCCLAPTLALSILHGRKVGAQAQKTTGVESSQNLTLLTRDKR